MNTDSLIWTDLQNLLLLRHFEIFWSASFVYIKVSKVVKNETRDSRHFITLTGNSCYSTRWGNQHAHNTVSYQGYHEGLKSFRTGQKTEARRKLRSSPWAVNTTVWLPWCGFRAHIYTHTTCFGKMNAACPPMFHVKECHRPGRRWTWFENLVWDLSLESTLQPRPLRC